jgi:hypothetical protein
MNPVRVMVRGEPREPKAKVDAIKHNASSFHSRDPARGAILGRLESFRIGRRPICGGQGTQRSFGCRSVEFKGQLMGMGMESYGTDN